MDFLQLLFQRLVNRSDAYYKQWVDGSRYGYQAVYQCVNEDLIAQHLVGDVTLAIPAVSLSGLSKWCAWDADSDDGNLEKIEQILEDFGWHTLREGRRKGRSGHLWMLFDMAVPAADLLSLDRQIRFHADVPDGMVEFFPKQAQPRALGSALRMPLGVHRKPGANNARGWFDGPALNLLSQLEWFANQQCNSARTLERISRLVKQSRRERLSTSRRAPVKSDERRDILQLVSERRRCGRDWVAQCPLCLAEGHDRNEDNLRISSDGTLFCCVYGGPGQVHKSSEIIASLLAQQRGMHV